MSPIPPFVVELRELVGQRQLWLPAVTAVVLHEGQVLLTRRADNGRWAPITGLLDPGEHPAVGAVREAEEEASVVVRADRLAATGVTPVITHANGDLAVYLDLTFACSWVSGEAAVGDDENLEVAWWPLDALPPMEAYLLERIEAAASGETAARFLS
ncbi:NUDIX domain-containing protein [Nocardioides fonticola]|uniref:NUDIX domain-containing protein n=1 Tax=Nocardioides fonticola TaxID=450363 RepID=A0ABP7XHM2_9ACTN